MDNPMAHRYRYHKNTTATEWCSRDTVVDIEDSTFAVEDPAPECRNALVVQYLLLLWCPCRSTSLFG